MFLAPLQRLDGVFTLGGIAHSAHQKVAVVAPLNEVVLGALANGFDSEGLIVGSGEDNNGNSRRAGVGAHERVESALVGQGQVQQDDIEILRVELAEGVLESGYMREPNAAGADV